MKPKSNEVSRKKSAQHKKVSVSKIDELDDAVYKGVSECNQSIENSIGEANQRNFRKLRWRLNEIDNEPKQHKRQYRDAESSFDDYTSRLSSLITGVSH